MQQNKLFKIAQSVHARGGQVAIHIRGKCLFRGGRKQRVQFFV